MIAPKSSPVRPAAAGARVVLLPATKFFVRRIPLVAGQDPGAQVGLALEGIGPFVPGQLFYGYCPSADGAQALIFAAYRRNFPAADTGDWNEADAVLPAFAVWLGQEAPARPAVWLHEQAGDVTALFWDGRSPLPAGVIARETGDRPAEAVREELLGEARSRLGAASADSKVFQGAPSVGALGKEGLALMLADRSAVLTPALLRAMDVRDKAELAGQIGRRQRDNRLWLVFAATAAALALCIAGELGLMLSNGLLARKRASLEAAAPAVRRVEQANQLVMRMEQLAGQSLRPFEMLSLLNAARPASLEFVRASTSGPRQMEIEAQSGNAADSQAYEQALGKIPEVEKAEVRDIRVSGGRTTFLVAVTFKPGFAGQGGAR
jgi:hypothetical protein